MFARYVNTMFDMIYWHRYDRWKHMCAFVGVRTYVLHLKEYKCEKIYLKSLPHCTFLKG